MGCAFLSWSVSADVGFAAAKLPGQGAVQETVEAEMDTGEAVISLPENGEMLGLPRRTAGTLFCNA